MSALLRRDRRERIIRREQRDARGSRRLQILVWSAAIILFGTTLAALAGVFDPINQIHP